MLLHYKLDDEIELDGKKYTVRASFDRILRVIDLLEDLRDQPALAVQGALKSLIDDELENYSFEDRKEVLEKILDQYVQMKEKPQYDLNGDLMPMPTKTESGAKYDYKQDADYIYAAFMQVYGIDLIEQQGQLHWAKFKALLKGLPKETMFSEIMRIRGWSAADEKKSHATRMRELQEQFRLSGKEDN